MKRKIAVVGATGLLGEKMIPLLKTNYDLRLYASKRKGKAESIEKLFTDLPDYCIFLSPENISRAYVPLLTKLNVKCIDNSSAFRLDKNVPLVVDEINGFLVDENTMLVANPNCTTIQLAIVLNCLKQLKIKRVVCSTYQSVSGAGKAVLGEYLKRTKEGKTKRSAHQIYDNILSQIGEIDSLGCCVEENKLCFESKKILSSAFEMCAQAVRVPVSYGHGVFACVVFEKNFSLQLVKELLQQSKTIVLCDAPMPISVRNTSKVFVGRLRKNADTENCLSFFAVADNLLRGAVFNAYEILLRMENVSG